MPVLQDAGGTSVEVSASATPPPNVAPAPAPVPAAPSASLATDALVPSGVTVPSGFLGSSVTLTPAPTVTPTAPAPALPPSQAAPNVPPADDFATDALVPIGVNVPRGFLGQNVTLVPAPSIESPISPEVAPTLPGEIGADRTLAAVRVLTHQNFVDYIVNGCQERGLDDLAVFADIYGEGISGKIGDGGWAYGPTQDHLTEFKGRPFYGKGKNNHAVNVWAWSDKGTNYYLDQMVKAGASGKHGIEALNLIIENYEKPKDIPRAEQLRGSYYYAFKADPETAYKLIAKEANGPTDTGDVTDTPPVSASSPASATGVAGTFRAFMRVLQYDIPKAGTRATTVGKGLTKVIR